MKALAVANKQDDAMSVILEQEQVAGSKLLTEGTLSSSSQALAELGISLQIELEKLVKQSFPKEEIHEWREFFNLYLQNSLNAIEGIEAACLYTMRSPLPESVFNRVGSNISKYGKALDSYHAIFDSDSLSNYEDLNEIKSIYRDCESLGRKLIYQWEMSPRQVLLDSSKKLQSGDVILNRDGSRHLIKSCSFGEVYCISLNKDGVLDRNSQGSVRVVMLQAEEVFERYQQSGSICVERRGYPQLFLAKHGPLEYAEAYSSWEPGDKVGQGEVLTVIDSNDEPLVELLATEFKFLHGQSDGDIIIRKISEVPSLKLLSKAQFYSCEEEALADARYNLSVAQLLEGETYFKFRDREKLAHSTLEFRVQPGMLLELLDGRRCVIRESLEEGLEVTFWKDGKYTNEFLRADALSEASNISFSNTDPHLVPGRKLAIDKSSARWNLLEPGTRLQYQDGRIEEIVALRSDFVNETRARSDSLIYYPDGRVEFKKNILREDREFTGPRSPAVFVVEGSKAIDYCKTVAAGVSMHYNLQEILAELSQSFENTALKSSDVISLEYARLKNNAKDQLRFEDMREDLLSACKDIYELTSPALHVFEELASRALFKVNDQSLSEVQKGLKSTFEKQLSIIKNSSMTLEQRLDEFNQEIKAAARGLIALSHESMEDPLLVELEGKLAQLEKGAMELCEFEYQLQAELSEETRELSKSFAVERVGVNDLTDDTADQVMRLIDQARRRAQGGHEAGVPRPEDVRKLGYLDSIPNLQKKLEAGAELTVLREGDKITGFMLGAPPWAVSASGGDSLANKAKNHCVYYSNQMLASPDSSNIGAVLEAVWNAHLVRCQFTDASYHTGEIHPLNPRSVGAVTKRLGVVTATSRTAEDRMWRDEPWLATLVPVSAHLRRHYYGRVSRKSLTKAYDRRAEGLAEDLPSAITYTEYVKLIDRAAADVYMRLTGPAANMSAREWKRWQRIAKVGLNNLACVVTQGPTKTYPVIDGEVSERARPAIDRTYALVKDQNPHAIWSGVLVMNRESTKREIIEGFNDNKPVTVLSDGKFKALEDGREIQGLTFTVEDEEMPNRVRLEFWPADVEGPIWDKEADVSREAGEEAEAYALKQGRKINKVLVAFGGGGTVGRADIERAAEAGWNVILVRGGDERSSTEKFASDRLWLDKYKDNVQVVDWDEASNGEQTGLELNRVLAELGAVLEPTEGADSYAVGDLNQLVIPAAAKV